MFIYFQVVVNVEIIVGGGGGAMVVLPLEVLLIMRSA